jgi:hypothetical protein
LAAKASTEDVDAVESDSDSGQITVDSWIEKKFWETMRGNPSKPQPGQLQIPLIKARMVVLANSKKVFLEEGQKVIEVGDVLNGTVRLEDLGAKLPRRRVRELSEGHRIALRTSRGGHYLVEVADELLRRVGKDDLRRKALDWKSWLRTGIETHGTAYLSQLLKKKGHVLSDHKYIWMWTTDAVIRPESESLFYELIAILHELNLCIGNADVVELAQFRWERMRELIHYHHLAGNEIRKALLAQLRDVLESGGSVEDEIHLTLPGAGALSLFLISDVDREVVEVPYNELDVIRQIEE